MITNVTSIEKFSGEGFHTWAMQMKNLLMYKKLWKTDKEEVPNVKTNDELIEKDE